MSRPKKQMPFPQILYIGITADNKIVIHDKGEDPLAFLQQLKTGRLGRYFLGASTDDEIKIRKSYKASKPAPNPDIVRKTCLDGTASAPPSNLPPEPDNAPSEATEANLPIVEGITRGKPVEIEDIPGCQPKKRHRRTKAEMAKEMKLAGLKPRIPKEEDNLKCQCGTCQTGETNHNPPRLKMDKDIDKPKWRCPNPDCQWEGDNPTRYIKGPYAGNFACPECDTVVIKN